MTASIPASTFVSVTPGVIGAGGNPKSLNAIFVDSTGDDTSIPIGTVQGFPNLAAVQTWYGANSNQAALAAVYFGGFTGCTQLPGMLWFAQFPGSAAAAYLRGGSVAGMSLTTLQGFSGTLSATINGTLYTTGSINLAAATSFAEAATTLIQAGFTAVSAPVTCTYDTLRQAFLFTSTTTGTGSTITVMGGTLAVDLNLTTATGAVISPGSAVQTPAAFMNGVLGVTQNWATFMTVAQPVLSVMEAFAAWVNGQDQQYIYVNWDSNILATETPPQPTVYAQIVAQYNGCVSVYDATGAIAAFVCGAIASFDYTVVNGYTVLAGKSSALLTPNVTSATVYENLIANGYSAYCAIATANQNFQWFENGQISGEWNWIDEFVFQIWLNSEIQLAGMELIANTKSIPFNQAGITLQYSAYLGPIQAGLLCGGIQVGIELSPAQIAEVNNLAGANVAPTLFQQGFWMGISIPDSQVQGERGPWPTLILYTNAGGAQSLSVNDIDVQ